MLDEYHPQRGKLARGSLLCNGRSDRTPPERWTLANWADDVHAFCEALEIEKPIVMGTSFGGFVAMAYGTRYPEHPGKLVLCTTTAKWRLSRVLDAFERLGGNEARVAARNFWENPCQETFPDYIRTCFPLYNRNRRGTESMTRSVMNTEVLIDFPRREQNKFDFLPDLRRIKCPTLVMGGEDDPITPIQDSEEIAAALPPELMRFERFPATGHGIVRDAPERFIQLLKEFVTS